MRSKLEANGIEIQGGTPEQFGNVIKAEVEKWGRIIKAAGIKPGVIQVVFLLVPIPSFRGY